MYVKVLENCLFVIIIKSIFTNSKAILPLVIILSIIIIASQFYKNITRLKVITISLTSYTNKRIYITQLNYFIKHNDYKLNKPQYILLINKVTCYKAFNFVLKAKINYI